MIRYKRGFNARYNRLVKRGFLDLEALEIAGAYPTFQKYPDKSDPSVYIRKMVASRRWTIQNLRRLGYSQEMIEDFIIEKYQKNDWLRYEGELDVWKMLEYYRGIAISKGEYYPVKRRHGIRAGSVSKGDIKAQKARAAYRRRTKAGKLPTAEEQDRVRGR